MVTAAQPMTLEQLDQLEPTDDKVELHAGELVVMSPTGKRHARAQARLIGALIAAVDTPGLGSVMTEVGVVLSRQPDTLLAPDIAVSLIPPSPIGDEDQGFSTDVPDIVIEVVSPSDRASQIHFKTGAYLEAGVKVVIVVWPSMRQLSVSRRDGVTRTLWELDSLDLSDLIPGFVYPIRTLFS